MTESIRLRRAAALLDGPWRIWAFISALALVSAGLWTFALRTFSVAHVPGGVSVSWWELAIAFYLAEVFVVHLQFRKQAHTLSLTEIGIVLGLFFASPGSLLVAQILGATAALAINRRQRPIKLVFNAAELSLCTAAALLIFRSLADPAVTSLQTWGVVLLAAAVAHATGVGLVSAVIAVAERQFAAPQLLRTLFVSLVGSLATTSLALAGVELLENEPGAVLLLAVPIIACLLAFRGYMRQREQREHVEFLYESMRATQGVPEFGLAVGQLLVAARRLLRAEYAEILLVSPTAGEPPIRSVSGPEGEMLMHADTDTDPIDVLALAQLDSTGRPILLGRRRRPHVLDGFLASRGVGEAVVGALRGEHGPLGLLIVGERAGEVSSFGDDDVDLFETFAGHASVLLQNSRLERSLAQVTELKEQLRHEAYHDSLTGLPNRVNFVESVTEALANGEPVTVLYLDLDRFKTVNDSWGHPVGDELLVHVAERIRQALRPHDLPARLGGDEFAVLLRGADAEVAAHIAERLNTALTRVFTLTRGETTIRASIGIAVSGLQITTADELIRDADIAMYSAKRLGQRSYAVYEPHLHDRLRAERELALDLESAVERGEIVVHYQPIVSLVDGRVRAFEALVRWQHPTRGLLLPGEFLQTAEDSGLIAEIDRCVIDQALGTLRDWPAASDIGLWFNLAPAELTNERLVDDLAIALTRAGVDADRITVEITESGVFRDEEGALVAMRRLRDLGVHLSIDDFGTGYSSLSRLATFPIESLKVPRPFVSRLAGAEPEETFVDAILRLAESLGLGTVGEGIEQVAEMRKLRQLGCGLGQGYLFSRPLGADAAGRLLAHPRADLRLVSTLAVA